LPEGDAFSLWCEEVSNQLKEIHLLVDSAVLYSIANMRLVIHLILVRCLLPAHLSLLGFGGVRVSLLFAIHHLAWTQHPTIWLCESFAILWLVLRAVRSPWVRAGVLLMLCGLILNALVTQANAGTMPVVGIPSTLHPASPMWRAATTETRLPLLADQARLGLFSVGDLVMIFGGILVIAICARRALRMRRRVSRECLGWIPHKMNRNTTCPAETQIS
jgi:hypothetical protein